MGIIAFVMGTENDLRAKIKEKSNRQPQCSPMTSKTKSLRKLTKLLVQYLLYSYNPRKYKAQYSKGVLLLR